LASTSSRPTSPARLAARHCAQSAAQPPSGQPGGRSEANASYSATAAAARFRTARPAMRARALHADPARLERARGRAKRRAERCAHRERLGLRRPGAPRLETGEQRRRRERDELLLAGEHPGLSADVGRTWWEAWRRYDAGLAEPAGLSDGLTARALHYRDELAAGRLRAAGSAGLAGDAVQQSRVWRARRLRSDVRSYC
jgi:hypothetical protein